MTLTKIKTAFGARAHEAKLKINQAWHELRDPMKRGWVNDDLIYEAERLRKAQETLLCNPIQQTKRKNSGSTTKKKRFGRKNLVH